MSIVIIIPLVLAFMLLSYVAWRVIGLAVLRRSRRMGVAIGIVATLVITVAVAATWLLANRDKEADLHATESPVSASTPAAAPPPKNTGGDLAQLAERLEARLKREPGDAEGWALLARTQVELQHYPGAVAAYTKAVSMLPKDADLRVEFAHAEFQANDRQWTKAATDATTVALTLKPEHPEALWLAGTQQFVKKNYAASVRHWEKLLRIAPANFDHARDLATSLIEARALRDGKDPATALAAAGVVARPVPAAAEPPPASAPTDEKSALARELQTTLRAMGGATQAPVKAAPGKRVTGVVTLQPALRYRVAQDATVFIFARADGGGKPAMPLAAKRYRVSDLPIRFDLSDADAMSPEFTLSSASTVVIVARVSRTGDARAQAGDFEGISRAIAVGTQEVSVLIDKAL